MAIESQPRGHVFRNIDRIGIVAIATASKPMANQGHDGVDSGIAFAARIPLATQIHTTNARRRASIGEESGMFPGKTMASHDRGYEGDGQRTYNVLCIRVGSTSEFRWSLVTGRAERFQN